MGFRDFGTSFFSESGLPLTGARGIFSVERGEIYQSFAGLANIQVGPRRNYGYDGYYAAGGVDADYGKQ